MSTLSHIHNTPPAGTYSIFSGADLESIAEGINKNEIDPADFVATLSTHKGTHYALTISDPVKFSDFFHYILNDYFSNAFTNLTSIASQTQFKNSRTDNMKLLKKYFDDKNGLIQSNNPNNEDVLGLFLDFLNEADIGITLFETKPDVNNQNILFYNYWHVSKSGVTVTRTLYN